MRTFYKVVAIATMIFGLFLFWQVGGWKMFLAAWLLVISLEMEIDSNVGEVYRSCVRLIDRITG